MTRFRGVELRKVHVEAALAGQVLFPRSDARVATYPLLFILSHDDGSRCMFVAHICNIFRTTAGFEADALGSRSIPQVNSALACRRCILPFLSDNPYAVFTAQYHK